MNAAFNSFRRGHRSPWRPSLWRRDVTTHDRRRRAVRRNMISPAHQRSSSRYHTWRTCCLHLLIMTIFVTSLVDVDAKLFSTQMSQRIINTRQGRLRGLLITLPNRTLPSVEAYLGLEFASLRGRELRFMPPTVARTGSWHGVRTALKFRPICPQRVPTEITSERFGRILPFLEPQQEDCLYLNVYLPLGPSPGTCQTVIIFFIIIIIIITINNNNNNNNKQRFNCRRLKDVEPEFYAGTPLAYILWFSAEPARSQSCPETPDEAPFSLPSLLHFPPSLPFSSLVGLRERCSKLPQRVHGGARRQTVFATLLPQKKAIHGPNLSHLP